MLITEQSEPEVVETRLAMYIAPTAERSGGGGIEDIAKPYRSPRRGPKSSTKDIFLGIAVR